ncbi:hypothetical protein [Caulobacter sp. LARHSG274]
MLFEPETYSSFSFLQTEMSEFSLDAQPSEAQSSLVSSNDFEATSAYTAADEPTWVSEIVVVAGSTGQPTTYVSFSAFSDVSLEYPNISRDIGLVDEVIVEADDTPDTPLEWERALDVLTSFTAQKMIMQFIKNDPSLEYGAYIYVGSDGKLYATPMTTGTPTSVDIDLHGVDRSQIIGIVHYHPGSGDYLAFPSPDTSSDGVVSGDWGQYDYFSKWSTYSQYLSTYIVTNINAAAPGQLGSYRMHEYRGGDRDTNTFGQETPVRVGEYYR